MSKKPNSPKKKEKKEPLMDVENMSYCGYTIAIVLVGLAALVCLLSTLK